MPPERTTDALEEPLLSADEREEPLLGEEEDYQQQPLSRNIRLTLAYTFFAFAGRSLWSQSVLATYVFLLTNNNAEAVGFVTAAMGLAQLIVSFPSGILADKYRRDVVLRTAAVIGTIAIGLTVFSLYQESYLWLVVSLSVWGVTWGIANTSLSALFADSIPDGDRTKYFTYRSTLIQLGICMGPLLALILFACLGDHWSVRECAVVMSCGQSICFPGLVILCCMSDDAAVQDNNATPLLTPVASANNLSVMADEETQQRRYCCCVSERRIIPVSIATADVLSGLGAGMSIRYFPVFFVQNLKLNPVAVQTLYIISPLMQVCFMQIAQRLSKRLGRCRVASFFKWTGITFMLLMIAAYLHKLPTVVVCTLYLFRTATINSTTALTKSVLMDNVPKKERGKWSALESVNMFSWSGSAALGGFLVGLEGIIFNFCITAAIQGLATMPLVFLWSKESMEGDQQLQQQRRRQEQQEQQEQQQRLLEEGEEKIAEIARV